MKNPNDINNDRTVPEKNINNTQKQILDLIIEICFESILSSYLGLTGLEATLNEKLFEIHKEGFENTDILRTLQVIKDLFKHLRAKQSGKVMPWRLWPRWPIVTEKYCFSFVSLTAANDATAAPITKQAVLIYISDSIENKIKQLKDINFNKLLEDLQRCIEENDLDNFKDIITIFKNNQVSIDIYHDDLRTPLARAAFYGRPRMVEFLLDGQAEQDFKNSKKLSSSLLLNALGVQDKLFDSKFNITEQDRYEVLELLIQFGFSIENIPCSVAELVISQDVVPRIVNLILAHKKYDFYQTDQQKVKKLLDPVIIIQEFKKYPNKITKEKLQFFLDHGVNFYQKDQQGFSIVDCLLAYYEKVDIAKDKFKKLLTRLFDNTLPDYYHLRYVDHSGKIVIPVLDKSAPPSLAATTELTNFIEEYHEKNKLDWEEASEALKKFPDEILLNIILHVDITSKELTKFLQLALVSKHWHEVFNELIVFKKIVENASNDELSRLMRASCLEGSFEKVSILLSSERINLSYRDKDRKGFLHHACISGSIEIAVLLLDKARPRLKKADKPIKSADLEGNIPLQVAVAADKPVKLKADLSLLLVESADSEGNIPLHLAVAADNFLMFQLLLQISPADQVNAENKEGDSLLHKVQSAAIAEVLILHGAKVRCWNRKQESPLFRAIDLELTEVVACLIKFKASIKERLDLGVGTFLHMAVRKGNLEILRLLLENGADVSAEFNCFEGSEEDKFLTPRRLAQIIEIKLLMDPAHDKNLRKKITEVLAYLEDVEKKYGILFSRLHAMDKIPEGWLFIDDQRKEQESREALKDSQNVIYLKIFEKDCSVEEFKNLISSLKGTTYLDNVAKKYLVIGSIFSEANRLRQSTLYKSKEKAKAIEIALDTALSRFYAKIFAKDCSVEEFENLIFNTSHGRMSVKEALALDFTPLPIASLVASLQKFFGDDQNPEDPKNSASRNFTP